MLEILAITGPIFLLIGTGFAAVRSGLLERAGIRPLGTFVVNFALPAMLFKTMAERRLDEALHWDMVIAYGLGSLLMVALTLAFTRFVQRRDLLTGAVFSMGTAMANSSFVGFPIALGSALGYTFNGYAHAGLPPFSLGYVYLPALAWIVPPSMLVAPFGARVAHRVPVATLKRVFAGLLIVLAGRMLWKLFH